jgi:hypothetical protein
MEKEYTISFPLSDEFLELSLDQQKRSRFLFRVRQVSREART